MRDDGTFTEIPELERWIVDSSRWAGEMRNRTPEDAAYYTGYLVALTSLAGNVGMQTRQDSAANIRAIQAEGKSVARKAGLDSSKRKINRINGTLARVRSFLLGIYRSNSARIDALDLAQDISHELTHRDERVREWEKATGNKFDPMGPELSECEHCGAPFQFHGQHSCREYDAEVAGENGEARRRSEYELDHYSGHE